MCPGLQYFQPSFSFSAQTSQQAASFLTGTMRRIKNQLLWCQFSRFSEVASLFLLSDYVCCAPLWLGGEKKKHLSVNVSRINYRRGRNHTCRWNLQPRHYFSERNVLFYYLFLLRYLLKSGAAVNNSMLFFLKKNIIFIRMQQGCFFFFLLFLWGNSAGHPADSSSSS